jgi:hypothetical protein
MNVAPFRPQSFAPATLVIAALVTPGCRSGESTKKAPPDPTRDLLAAPIDAGTPPRALAQDSLGSIYPPSIEAHPLARELCDALYLVPAERAAACCGKRPTNDLGEQCVRAVSVALRDRAVEVEEASVGACKTAMEHALAGCDWVTPGQPLAPPACQRLLQGKLPAATVCRSSLECAGHLHCAGLGPTKTGLCVAPGELGQGCGSPIDVLATYALERGLETSHPLCADYCSLTTHKCEAAPVPGARCASAANCAPGQTCVAGACASSPPGKAGDRCGAVPCGAGLHCREDVCSPLSMAGQACVTDLDCSAGGCALRADGAKTCGMKCSPSFEALQSHAGPAMGLPLVRRF